jgi:hypothetical protein
MRNTRWINTTQPQTLFLGTVLLYISAALALLSGGFGLIFIAGNVAAGYGIANERKWGWILGLVIAGLAVLTSVALAGLSIRVLIGNAFDILLLVLLLHPQSREYERIWFK